MNHELVEGVFTSSGACIPNLARVEPAGLRTELGEGIEPPNSGSRGPTLRCGQW